MSGVHVLGVKNVHDKCQCGLEALKLRAGDKAALGLVTRLEPGHIMADRICGCRRLIGKQGLVRRCILSGLRGYGGSFMGCVVHISTLKNCSKDAWRRGSDSQIISPLGGRLAWYWQAQPVES